MDKLDAIRLSFLSKQELYERLYAEIARLFDHTIDPRFPVNSVYTIKFRIKDIARLIEKIEIHNQKNLSDIIDDSNYQSKLDDLLGIRIVSFRRSDKEIIKTFIKSLESEKKIDFVRLPEEKKPQFQWVEVEAEGTSGDIQYSGYSSAHFFITLHDDKTPLNLRSLRAELQVRTIFEDAWAELDHKYRYEFSRKGVEIPKSVDRGFRSLAAYIQVAQEHAEFLCKDIEEAIKSDTCVAEPAVPKQPEELTVDNVLKSKIGFIPTSRTLAYLERRICLDARYDSSKIPHLLQLEVLNSESLEKFNAVYKEILKKEPFKDSSDRDIDLINIVNYVLEKGYHGEQIAEDGLKYVLSKRKFQTEN